MQILYEDNYLLALDKPPGLQVECDRFGNPSLEGQVADYLRQTFPWKKQLIAGVAHRLDRAVSGVVLFAKTPAALKDLGLQFEKREVRKVYLALVEGQPPQPEAELMHWLRKDDTERRAVVESEGVKGAQESRLRFAIKKVFEKNSLLEIELLTGRYHQIRAQLNAVGFPIVGDEKYGSKTSRVGEEGICLHAHRLVVRHPKTGEEMEFVSECGFGR